MRKQHHPNGPGVRATDAFLAGIAALSGGDVAASDDAWRLTFRDGREDQIVPRSPKSEDEWRTHFTWIEKQAAVILRNPPVLYAIAWPRARNVALRLSAVVSLSIGTPVERRYVCTIARGGTEAQVEEGGVLPDVASAQTTSLAALPSWAERDLRAVARALADACRKYELLPEVQKSMAAIAERRRTELAYVDHLYGVREREHQRLWGLPPHGTRGSAAVEAEARRLRLIVLERYAPRVRVQPLSIGVLSGPPKGSPFGGD